MEVVREAEVIRNLKEWAQYHPELLMIRNHTQGILMSDGRLRPNENRGAADLLLQVTVSGLPICVWFEAKGSKGTLSDHQQAFGESVRRLGGYYFVVRSVQDAEDAIAQVERDVRAIVPTGMRRVFPT